LDDFALRTILKTALNIALRRSHDVFERTKQAIFCVARDFLRRKGFLLNGRSFSYLDPS
jgi:hypothetical protein